MSKLRLSRALGAVLLVSVAGEAMGTSVVFTGTLDTSDPLFNRPTSATALSAVGTAVAYDVFTFTAEATGPYSVVGDYTAGGIGSATGLDGYLLIYTSFNPASALANLVAGDDDWPDPDGAGPLSIFDGSLIPSSGSYGPGTTTSVLNLIGGTTYTLVVTAFDNATGTDPNRFGPYTVTVNGAIPAPGGAALLGGLALCTVRRRR